MNIEKIKQAAKQTTDKDGNPVIQIPLSVWQGFITQEEKPQIEQIQDLLQEWEREPDDTPDSWWDGFMDFLAESRLNFAERDES